MSGFLNTPYKDKIRGGGAVFIKDFLAMKIVF
jgi:hypothetical protein